MIQNSAGHNTKAIKCNTSISSDNYTACKTASIADFNFAAAATSSVPLHPPAQHTQRA
jgi:hypothetical protein